MKSFMNFVFYRVNISLKKFFMSSMPFMVKSPASNDTR
jgi:hypothetical protein